MWKAIVVVLFILYVVYLFMALGQAFNIIKFTNRKITVGRMLVPFYYWIAPSNEKKLTKKHEYSYDKVLRKRAKTVRH